MFLRCLACPPTKKAYRCTSVDAGCSAGWRTWCDDFEFFFEV